MKNKDIEFMCNNNLIIGHFLHTNIDFTDFKFLLPLKLLNKIRRSAIRGLNYLKAS